MAEKINSLASDNQCLSHLVEQHVFARLFPGMTVESLVDVAGGSDFYYVSPEERRALGFLVAELDHRTKTLLELTDDFVEHFLSFSRSLKKGGAK
ncbi:hypothetical protein [Agrobacterium vitis]|uniref:hypothetical protein n=1 Tax=Agrobacterium vitis TaxID=373 RepID=UPI0012E87BE1|nr:hypothetical protein [Agrobacterium vitis]MVA36113.1 hypothetical protein [Agrobacterium vitis]